ncbi:Uncharacterized protein APZ42_008686, partial [Daphnia magna]
GSSSTLPKRLLAVAADNEYEKHPSFNDATLGKFFLYEMLCWVFLFKREFLYVRYLWFLINYAQRASCVS